MKKVSILLVIVLSIASVYNVRGQSIKKYDVVIYGGTSAGVMAALAVAKMGESVVLLTPQKHVGGITTSGLGWTDKPYKDGENNLIGGLTRDFYLQVYDYYKNANAWQEESRDEYVNRVANTSHKVADGLMWTFEPHVAEDIFDTFLKNAHVTVLLNTKLNRKTGVNMVNGHINSITMLNGDQFRGKVFIDATYTGDLMAAAGVSFTMGRESNCKYGETLDGIETALTRSHQFPRGVSPYKIENDPSSSLLPNIDPNQGGADGSGDNKVQSFNYRICLTDAPNNQMPITRPNEYDSSQYELLVRLFKAQPKKRSLFDYFIWSPMPNRKTDINNLGAFSTDLIGMNDHFIEADYKKRTLLLQKYESYTKGLLYFMGHDPRVPQSIRDEMLKWGYPKDEFQPNNYWPYELYIREGRRMISNFVMTQQYIQRVKDASDPIAIGYYNMDSHNTQRYVTPEGDVQNEGDVEVYPGGPYLIPYGTIIPKLSECTNLLVPVCLSASHIAYSSIRMEPVFMEIGQAAGTAAALAAKSSKAVQEINYPKLRKLLLDDGQILSVQ
ncbi:MAG: FAD-dependent oxidoreductase [Chitinophagaceae bacterium]|nr:MAG: FAD-dependent oxidoreductase [Chitinophagaceae bacterium]